MRSSNQSVVATTQARLTVCMNALKSVSKVWLVAKMVHTLFESILGNKQLEERLQKAAGKAHKKVRPASMMSANPSSRSDSDPKLAPKRKYDDMDFGTYTGGPPAAQMSYERSRPQSPVNGPKDAPPHMPTTIAGSPPLRQNNDAFMGASRGGTRQTTPFNTYSYPGTPPDLFLHTRNSPNISQDLWQNYQPDQLFPPGENSLFPMSSPEQPHGMVDPALRPQPAQPQPSVSQYPVPAGVNVQPPAMQQHQPQQTQPTPPHQQMQNPMQHATPMHARNGMPSQHQTPGSHHTHQIPQAQYQDHVSWVQAQEMNNQRQAEDSWSQHSGQSSGVPTTLNVDDWFQFFGIPHSDIAAVHGQY